VNVTQLNVEITGDFEDFNEYDQGDYENTEFANPEYDPAYDGAIDEFNSNEVFDDGTQAPFVDGQFNDGFVDGQFNDGFVDGQFDEVQFVEGGEFNEVPFVEGQFEEGPFVEGQFEEGQFVEGQFEEGQFVEGQFEGQFVEGQFTGEYDEYGQPIYENGNEYGNQGYGTDEYGNQLDEYGNPIEYVQQGDEYVGQVPYNENDFPQTENFQNVQNVQTVQIAQSVQIVQKTVQNNLGGFDPAYLPPTDPNATQYFDDNFETNDGGEAFDLSALSEFEDTFVPDK